IARAVYYAHERGILHRDLKPQNVMIGRYGEVLVMDWGLAKVLAWVDEAKALGASKAAPAVDAALRESGPQRVATHFGAVIGTPAYMAPEQAEGDTARIGPATDIFALGAT